MKVFKTELITNYFNTKYLRRIEPDKILLKTKESSKNKFICNKKNYPQNFLSKKVCHFRVVKYNSILGGQTGRKKGRWTLKEHMQYLQALEKFEVNWKKIYDLIPSRTPTQIRSHSQKF